VSHRGNTENFVAALAAERDQAAAFVVLLRAEQQALRDGVTANVERLAPEKARMAENLARCTEKREKSLAAMGYERGARGMQQWAKAQAGNSAGTEAWQRLQQHAGEAHALNEANGKLIDLRLRHCRQALAALEHACGVTPLYGPLGHTTAVSASRPLSAA
jgi:flagella synthesis protein FlgN